MKSRLSPGVRTGIGLALGAFLVYVATLMPGVPPTDGGELALAAWLPGVAHAPGFPLWTALAWAWSHLLPLGRVVWRLNLFSALCAALAVGLTYALALNTLPEGDFQDGRARTLRLLPAALAAILLALGRTFWGWATIAEVYALNTALIAAILLLVVCWTGLPSSREIEVTGRYGQVRTGSKPRAQRAKPAQAGSPRAKGQGIGSRDQGRPGGVRTRSVLPLIAAAALFGLGLGAHLTSVALLAPAIALWITACRGWRFWVSRVAPFGALAVAAGAAIYLWIPLVASTDPLLNWGRADTWQRFWWHVTAKQYRVSLLSAPVLPQVGIAAQLWWTQYTPVGVGLALLGAWQTLRNRRQVFFLVALVVLCVTLYAWAYVIEDDGDAYYLPAFVAAGVWVAWGARTALAWVVSRPVLAASRRRMTLSVASVVFVLALALIMNARAANRRGDTISEDYVRDAFAEIAPGGVLLTRDWQFYAPALYLQQVEKVRSDVTVVDTELLRRGWYFDLLHRVDPALMAAVGSEERGFLALRDAWERGEIPDSDPRIGQLQAAYIALLDALIREASASGRPVHAGPNRGTEPLRTATLRGVPDLEAGAGIRWRWIPVGLTFRALPASAQPPPLAALNWRLDAFRNTIPTAPERKVQATRADMATLRAVYHASTGNSAAAQADLGVALAVDPNHAPAKELLGRLKAGQ